MTRLLDLIKDSSQSVLTMSSADARRFFMKPSSYCNIDLPNYFDFSKILISVSEYLREGRISDHSQRIREQDGLNYRVLVNKDGGYAWRPLEIIHPAIYYDLVQAVTEETNWTVIGFALSEYQGHSNIECLSIPVESLSAESDRAEQISKWWAGIEQRSVELCLDYSTVAHTDIVDCYGSIYTHSIAWALHSKEHAQATPRDMDLAGNQIDRAITSMRKGQTNGIPQGSVLMDFIAEIVLCYADSLLAKSINNSHPQLDYKVLRYRDDYRIFCNSDEDCAAILKKLSEVLSGLGMRLSPAKTSVSTDPISVALKRDKMAWLRNEWIGAAGKDLTIEKHAIIVHQHLVDHPNAGSGIRSLGDLNSRVHALDDLKTAMEIISIATDIAHRNPKTYPIIASLISKLMRFLPTDQSRSETASRIHRKFRDIPNTGYLDIWLQRFTRAYASNIKFNDPLCDSVIDPATELWNSSWIKTPELKQILNNTPIVDQERLAKMDDVIPPDEVALFIERAAWAS
ncbi:MAG: RNA-directed DNA polymerase [Phycisphaeraceae bacterium]